MDNIKALRILHDAQVYLPSIVPGLGGGGIYIFSSMKVLAHGADIEDAMRKGGFFPPPVSPSPAFIAVGLDVLRSGVPVAKAGSVTMARRIANALNFYAPNKKGV